MTGSLQLPFPPSVNNLYRTAGRKRIPAAHYVAWRQHAGWELSRQRPTKHVGRVSILVELKAPDARRHDADNCLKAVVDLLVSHQIIEADDMKIVRSVTATWVEHGEPRATITIEASL